MRRKTSQEKNQFFFELHVLKNANKGQTIVLTLKKPYAICLIKMIFILSTSHIICNIQFFIQNIQYSGH